jgi:nucleoside-diphosphate-sugar epimerase
MIRWITNELGTAPYDQVGTDPNFQIIDVRDLVDKRGNSDAIVKEKIGLAIAELKVGRKVVICCDRGMSRSNAIAAGILALYKNITLNQAIQDVMQKIGEKSIKIEVLAAIRSACGFEEPVRSTHEKRILVTGASGFIGTALIPIISAHNRVFTVGRSEINLLTDSVQSDIFIKENQITHVLHLANPRVYTTNQAMGESLVLLKNVLDFCLENRLKLFYTSSWEVYSGYRSRFLLASEALTPFPKGAYGETKYLCEALINHYRMAFQLECTLLRISPVYGEGSNKPRFIYNFLETARTGKDIVTHRYLNGCPSLDLLNISDLTEALKMIIENDLAGDFNIGSGQPVSTKEVAELLKKIVGSKSMVKHQAIEEYAANIAMDISKIKSAINWVPKIDIDNGLTRICSNMRI